MTMTNATPPPNVRQCGLVLAGGGGRGAYQIGCWKALKDFGYHVQSVAGVSVGGLNAALVAINDVDLATSIWLNTSNHGVYRWDVAHWLRAPLDGMASFLHLCQEQWQRRRLRLHAPALRALAYTLYRRGFFNTRRGLREIIRQRLDPERLRQSTTNTWVTVLQTRGWLPWTGQPLHCELKSLSAEEMGDVLLASAALPFLFPAVRSGRRWLADAGWATPLPIEPVYRDGARLIFAVYLHPNQTTDAAEFPGASIIDVCPREDIGTMLGFSPERSRRNMDLGYRDMMRALEAKPS